MEKIWYKILEGHKHLLDLSIIQLDGTHTPAKRGDEAVAYQVRKKRKTCNMLILSDNQEIPLTCSDPVAVNHNDAHDLVSPAKQMIRSIQTANILTEGLFLNADSSFDTTDFRTYCCRNEIIGNIDLNNCKGSISDQIFDDLLYKRRFVIERTNAWLDAFKAILVCFETNKIHWKAINLLAFALFYYGNFKTSTLTNPFKN